MKILRLAVDRGGACCCRSRRASRPRPRCASASPRTPTCSTRRWRAPMSAASCSPSFCDKLFDIDEKLNIVPQLALSHETSADGKAVTIKLRPGVKFHDGEPFDAEAAKYSLERHLTMQGSFRKPELAARRPGRGGRSADHQAGAEGAVLAADRAAHRPRRHDGVAEGGEGGRRQVRPEAGLRRALQVRRARAAGPHRRSRNSPTTGTRTTSTSTASSICRSSTPPCGSPTCKSGSLDLIERVLATDIKEMRADPEAEARRPRIELGYQGITINVGKRQGQGRRSASPRRCARRSTWRSTARRINQVVFNGEFVPGNQWVSPEHPYYQKAFPVPKRDVAKAKALLKEAGVTTPDQRRLHGAERRRKPRQVAQVIQSMAAEAGFDMKIRVTEFATSLKQAEAGEFQAYLLGLERPHRSRRQHPTSSSRRKAPQNYGALLQSRSRQGARRRRASSPTRRSARRSTRSSRKAS